jgi:hypothetical protein
VLCYLNRGIILEQVILAELHRYIAAMKLDSFYGQHHIHATLNHPFAYLFKEQGPKAADHFPAVIVSTYEDVKDSDLNQLRPQTQGDELSLIGFTGEDLDAILDIYEPELANGKQVKKPGICVIASEESINAIRARLEESEYVYGYSLRSYRKDHISIEIWAENIQLKNELYEQLRLFVLGDLRNKLTARYGFYDIKLDDDTVTGQRSNAWNIDFDVALAGANIRFDVTYAIEQNVMDTDWDDIHREIIIGGINHAR